VEIETEAAKFPEKKYINGIFLAMYCTAILKQFVHMNLFLKYHIFETIITAF